MSWERDLVKAHHSLYLAVLMDYVICGMKFKINRTLKPQIPFGKCRAGALVNQEIFRHLHKENHLSSLTLNRAYSGGVSKM
jgi:hypothetical protein